MCHYTFNASSLRFCYLKKMRESIAIENKSSANLHVIKYAPKLSALGIIVEVYRNPDYQKLCAQVLHIRDKSKGRCNRVRCKSLPWGYRLSDHSVPSAR